MTIPSPPPYRKLERSRNDRVLGGVCGGLATYANLDPTLVRVLTVVISMFTGVPIILYLIALFVVPEEGSDQPPQHYPRVGGTWTYGPYPQQGDQPPTYAPGQAGPRQYGVPPTAEEEAVWGPAGAPWQQPPSAAPWQQPPPATPWQQPPPAEPGSEGTTGQTPRP